MKVIEELERFYGHTLGVFSLFSSHSLGQYKVESIRAVPRQSLYFSDCSKVCSSIACIHCTRFKDTKTVLGEKKDIYPEDVEKILLNAY